MSQDIYQMSQDIYETNQTSIKCLRHLLDPYFQACFTSDKTKAKNVLGYDLPTH